MTAESIYVSVCYRCERENRQRGLHVVCACGAEYWLEWPCEDE